MVSPNCKIYIDFEDSTKNVSNIVFFFFLLLNAYLNDNLLDILCLNILKLTSPHLFFFSKRFKSFKDLNL